MWRFMIISFAFLGWAFYVLSGGADYEPRTQSIQVRAQLDNQRPQARPGSTNAEKVAVILAGVDSALAGLKRAQMENAVASAVAEDATVTQAVVSMNDQMLVGDGLAKVSLASVSAGAAAEPTFESSVEKVASLTVVSDAVITDDITGVLADSAAQPDLRQVTGSVVNMRDGPSTYYLTIGQLKQGDPVEVLDSTGDGWLKIRLPETGQEGWMADWLVTAAAN